MSRQSSLSVRTGREQTSRKLLTVAQVVERLNVSELNVRHPIFQRRIGVVKIGRLVRIDERQLEEFIDLPCTYLKGAASPFPLISGGGNAVLGE